jgi:hypothetical protein
MTMKPFRRLATILASVACASAHAWNDTGHMVIAAIAHRNLTPSAHSEAERLLKVGGTERTRDFFTASVWADDVRPEMRETGPWHFINFFFRADGKRPQGKPEPENAPVAIARFSAILADRARPDAERADALRFVLHFVGDIHQPLHSVARESEAHPKGDRGGNDFKIKPPRSFSYLDRPPTNLHWLWDSGAGLFDSIPRPLSAEGRRRVEAQADTLIAALPERTFRNVREQDPMRWARESFETAKRVSYALPEDSEPSDQYLRAARAAAAQRATLAGYRLADLLNRTLR